MNARANTDIVVRDHIRAFWPKNVVRFVPFIDPPVSTTIPGFAIAEIEPGSAREPWTYVSVGASRIEASDQVRREFLLVAATRDLIHHETLAMLANMYVSRRLEVFMGKIIDIGRGWIPGSGCDHLLASRPYYQGPKFERASTDGLAIEFLWMTPIAPTEAEYARNHSVDDLERLLEENAIEVVDPHRPAVA